MTSEAERTRPREFARFCKLMSLNSYARVPREANVRSVVKAGNKSNIDTSNPVLHFHPLPLVEHLSAYSTKDVISCERVRVAGMSRLKVDRFANSFRVTLVPSAVIPSRLHGKIAVCVHRNASLGLCKCAKDEWKAIQKGQWSSIMSPYEDRYIDVRFTDGASGSVTISLHEECQQWRILFLGFGFVLLLLAPIVSHWVPFYYSSSIALGIVLVVLILLFQLENGHCAMWNSTCRSGIS
ncbi:uncharacterized protein [Aristolochia californica]|uniref:uncharacterized protein n=1 Tax=Aristolochia californica TaxID=171875 RepID=UPI0035DA408C